METSLLDCKASRVIAVVDRKQRELGLSPVTLGGGSGARGVGRTPLPPPRFVSSLLSTIFLHPTPSFYLRRALLTSSGHRGSLIGDGHGTTLWIAS